MADLKNLKNISAQDRKLIEDAETLLGPEPTSLGAVKNLFWGNFREDLYFPYPEADAKETADCDRLLAALEDYLKTEHPSVRIDQDQEIPRYVIDRLFKLGVMGMTIPKEYGGLGLGITSYNRVLELIGKYCGSTAVLVSAHQSIGCKAVMLFGNEEQKKKWLPHLANDWVSAFCLSEPNVGCDAGGQETRCERSADGEYYILNGEKKWATSGAISGLFTVMAKQQVTDPKTGKTVEKVTALVCHPDMPGVDIYSKNRSKCGIRGTWQARIRFKDVKVPKFNLLGQEGRGLNIALTCLNYGRCTLSAGMLGGARRSMDQAIKWSQTRFQFGRPLAEFELVRARIANMAALCYAMDSVLYMTTGMLDRHDEDIMLETAICKVFCSEMGWRAVNDAMQIMGGESYMTENEVERVFRDSRINTIVEGANEVMQGFIFGYGGKQLAESMLAVKDGLLWNGEEGFGANVSRMLKNGLNPRMIRVATRLGMEIFLGIRKKAPSINKVHPSLREHAAKLARTIQEHSHQFKLASKRYEEAIITRQAVQARIADNGMWLHAWACTLSRLDLDLRRNADGAEFERDRAAAEHFFDLAHRSIEENFRRLYVNTDETMLKAASAALKYSESLPNGLFSIPERSPIAKGTGRTLRQDGIKQFPGDAYVNQPVGAGVQAK
ncbi:MAG: acyl-CoA dehydrogenase family protein [Phycisphaerales bacterium]|jgi:acyl-CoA dehydrogenase family protein 9|nr:acyl-CoA dehydrogenase family protein [Phycisphaerales bacterium]